MKVLIDNILKEVRNGYIMEKIAGWPSLCPVSYHSSLVPYNNNREDNFRLITSGHVYVINYNENTYVPLKPETFKEYLNMKEKGLPIFKS